jgi:methyltransferase (TIGR00027 family)
MEAQLDPLAQTALWTASLRAREAGREDRLFTDPLAATLAGEIGPHLMKTFEADVQNGIEDPALAVRTRFFDDAMLRLAQRFEIRQFVLVAAGMDSRAFRLPWPDGVRMFELDKPSLLTLKEKNLHSVAAVPACEREAIGVDLTQDWATPLCAAGFMPGLPTGWLVEGLLYFLDDTELRALLSQLSDLSAHGSWLLADFVSRTSLESPSMSRWLDRMASRGHAWRSGYDDPHQSFGEYGWQVEATDYGSDRTDYGRWENATIAPGVAGTRGRYLVIGSRC